MSDEEITRKNQELLFEAGVYKPLPIKPCASTEERVIRISQDWRNLHGIKNSEGLYIVDSNPQSFLNAIKSIGSKAEILRAATIIRLGSEQAYDYTDITTGIRLVELPVVSYRFPTHPTPTS